jgi:hypothetical protein
MVVFGLVIISSEHGGEIIIALLKFLIVSTISSML